MAATVDDRRSIPLDRRDGTPKLPSRESLEELFARHPRVWYVVQPERHDNQNDPGVSAFLREHMDVVYEDFESLVLFRGENHRTAPHRFENERSLQKAKADFLQRPAGVPSGEPAQ